MKTFRLTVVSTPRDSAGDLIHRNYLVRARDRDEVEYFSTVWRVVPGSMDNVVVWHAVEIDPA